MRFVAYLCAVNGNDRYRRPRYYPNTGIVRILLVPLFKRPRAHTCDTLIPNNNYGRKSKEGSRPGYEGGNYQGTSDGQSPRPQRRFEEVQRTL